MDRLIYTGLTAMRAAMARQTVTANNLANVDTPGFRADISEAESLWLRGTPLETRAMASEEVLAADMRPGTAIATGRDLDVALGGDSLLSVQSESGEPAYTRRGDLQLTETGLLVTGDGHPVLGGQGPITLPPYDRVNISAEGVISIVPRGGDPGQPQEVDRLRLAAPAGVAIAKGLDGLFRAKDGSLLPEDPDARVTTGTLEGSNVSATGALVEMIEAQRSWDNQLKLLSDAREMDTSTADLMRLPQ
jgi:flagellar basal-body rod protein FlgF